MKTCLHILVCLCVLFPACFCSAQGINGLVAKFYFNEGNAKDEVSQRYAKTVGVMPAEDRFGNAAHAYYFSGSVGCYINLGTEAYLKPSAGTISLWFNMDNVVYSGKGYNGNPILVTKIHPGDDFVEAYCFIYGFNSKRVGTVSCNTLPGDTVQAGVASKMQIKQAKWYHAVMCYNDSFICLYINGEFQNAVAKNFRTKFLATDSVMLGHSASLKNTRYFSGIIDDVEIYDRILSPAEIMALYNAPDPNQSRTVIKRLSIVLGCVAGVALLMLLLLKRERNKSRKQRMVFEMEMQIIKAQMNPHFIFNAMNSLQLFVLANDNDNANKYLVKFSRLLRMILESNYDDHITLENEIEMLNRYIEIEALRFGKSFSYEITADAGIDTAEIKIPQMLLQPLVENAIWHGLLPKKNSRILSIHFAHAGEKELTCTIDDNGVGRKAQKEQSVVTSKRKSLAISLIYQRLELISREWNRRYGIEIRDKTDENFASTGTCIFIKLPILN